MGAHIEPAIVLKLEDELAAARRESRRWQRLAEERAVQIACLRLRVLAAARGEVCGRCRDEIMALPK